MLRGKESSRKKEDWVFIYSLTLQSLDPLVLIRTKYSICLQYTLAIAPSEIITHHTELHSTSQGMKYKHEITSNSFSFFPHGMQTKPQTSFTFSSFHLTVRTISIRLGLPHYISLSLSLSLNIHFLCKIFNQTRPKAPPPPPPTMRAHFSISSLEKEAFISYIRIPNGMSLLIPIQ
jgi:hypothetical protein